MTDELEEFIRGEIEKSGFPLEIEIYSILEGSRAWIPFANDYYYDYDEKKEREIDLTAVPMPQFDDNANIKNPTEPFHLNIELAIECKKNLSHAWVFFTRTCNHCFFYSGQRLDYRQIMTKDFQSSLFEVFLPSPDAGELLHYSIVDRLASSYTEVKLQNGNGRDDDIFIGSTQLIKFIGYRFNEMINRLSDSSAKVMILFFPVIVFDGRLYEATLGPQKGLSLKSAKHVLLERRSRLPFGGHEDRSFLIDVVSRDYFRGFLGLIESDIRNIEGAVVKKKRELMEKAELLKRQPSLNG